MSPRRHPGVDLSTPTIPGPRVTIQYAVPGAGKTTLSRDTFFRWPRAFAIDPQVIGGVGEYAGLVAHSVRDAAKLLEEYAPRPRFRVVLRGLYAREEIDPLLDACAESLYHALVVVEEADNWTTASDCPLGLYRIAHHGRRKGQGLILNARRPAALPRKLTCTANVTRAWRLHERCDLDALRGSGFPDPDAHALGSRDYYERVSMIERGANAEPGLFLVRSSGSRTKIS